MRIVRTFKAGVPRSRRKARAAARRIKRAAKNARAIIVKPAPALISPYAEQRSRYLDNLIRAATGLDLKGTRPLRVMERYADFRKPEIDNPLTTSGPRRLLAKMIVKEPTDGERVTPDRWTKRLTEQRRAAS
jgi:hypothetical protein